MRYLFVIILFQLLTATAFAQSAEMQTPADQSDKVARSAGGKLVRIVGVNYDRQAAPVDGPLGNVVEVTKSDFGRNSLCHALLKGLSVLDEESGYYVPFIPELFSAFGDSPASWPVALPRSCRGDGCYWSVLLKAADCLKAADADGYQASTMKEMLALHPGDLAERGRFLWSTGKCTDPETEKVYECSVPINDPTVITGRTVRVLHGWSGRFHDLGFAPAKDGVILPRPTK